MSLYIYFSYHIASWATPNIKRNFTKRIDFNRYPFFNFVWFYVYISILRTDNSCYYYRDKADSDKEIAPFAVVRCQNFLREKTFIYTQISSCSFLFELDVSLFKKQTPYENKSFIFVYLIQSLPWTVYIERQQVTRCKT